MAVTNNFHSSKLELNGQVNLFQPTALVWGDDGRLYVTENGGTVNVLTVDFGDPDVDGVPNFYVTEAVALSLGAPVDENNQPLPGIVNHDDDGTPNNNTFRQTTGIDVTQQYDANGNPQFIDANGDITLVDTGTPAITMYVTSSDSRTGAGGSGADLDLDTNSGVITMFTQTGADTWDQVDIVRGLPRSEENHATNGLEIIQEVDSNGILISERGIVANGGNANTGAPSNNFAGQEEQPLSAAILEVNITGLKNAPVLDDNGRKYVYDVPTLDDPARPNSGVDSNGRAIEDNDPFGGNDSRNSAIYDHTDPFVTIYSPGYRNSYDVEVTEDGRVWTYDNGANNQWGGRPHGENSPGNGTTNPDQVEGYIATNLNNGDGNNNDDISLPNNWNPSNNDNFHEITRSDDLDGRALSEGAFGFPVTYELDGKTYVYGGHPNPTRAEGALAGLLFAPGAGTDDSFLLVSDQDTYGTGDGSDFAQVVAFLNSVGAPTATVLEVTPGVLYDIYDDGVYQEAGTAYSGTATLLGQAGLPADIADIVSFQNEVEGNYLEGGRADGALDSGKGSINGLAEYTSTILDDGNTKMSGAILATVFNQSKIIAMGRNADGTMSSVQDGINAKAADQTDIAATGGPLGIDVVGDDFADRGLTQEFQGSIWTAVYKGNEVETGEFVFEVFIEVLQPDNGAVTLAGEIPVNEDDRDFDGIDKFNDPFEFSADNGLALAAGEKIVLDFNAQNTNPDFNGTLAGNTGLLGAALDGPNSADGALVADGIQNAGATANQDAVTGGYLSDAGDLASEASQEDGLFDLAGNIIPGGNAPILQIKEVVPGTMIGTANTARDVLHTGILPEPDVTRIVATVTAKNWVPSPETTLADGMVTGLVFGDGTQSNFLRFVFGQVNGVLGLHVGYELDDSNFQVLATEALPDLSNTNLDLIDLRLEIDIDDGFEVKTFYRLYDGVTNQPFGFTEVDLGNFTLPSGVLQNVLTGNHTISDGDTTATSGAAIGIVAETTPGNELKAVDFPNIEIEAFGNEIEADTAADAGAAGTTGVDQVVYTGDDADPVTLAADVENFDGSGSTGDYDLTTNDLDNVIQVGEGANTITTGDGEDEVIGTKATLDGDTVTDVSFDDKVVIQDATAADAAEVIYGSGSATLQFGQDGPILTLDGQELADFDPADAATTFQFVDGVDGLEISLIPDEVLIQAINAGAQSYTYHFDVNGNVVAADDPDAVETITFEGDGGPASGFLTTGSQGGGGSKIYPGSGNGAANANATVQATDFGDNALNELHWKERSSNQQYFGYEIEVENGNYRVDLYLAEIFHGLVGANSDGSRTFDIIIEGETVEDNLTLGVSDAGIEQILSYEFVVADGAFTIDFDARASAGGNDQPKISGLALYQVGGQFVPPADTTAPEVVSIEVENPQGVQDDPRTATVVLSDSGGFDQAALEALDGTELQFSGIVPATVSSPTVVLSNGGSTATLTYTLTAVGQSWDSGVGTITIAEGAYPDAAGNTTAAASGDFVFEPNLDNLVRGNVVRAINVGTTDTSAATNLAADPLDGDTVDNNRYAGAIAADSIITDAFGNPIAFEADDNAFYTSPKGNGALNANVDGQSTGQGSGSNSGGVDLDGSAYHTYRDSTADQWSGTYTGFANGTYVVELHFAELFHTSNNLRVGDFTVNGRLIDALNDLDVHAAAGGDDTPYLVPVPVTVTDGTITVEVNAEGAGQAGYSAIVVYDAVPSNLPPTISVDDVSVSEGETATVTFSRIGDATEAVTVEYELTGATDDTTAPLTGTVVIPANAFSVSIDLPITDDDVEEGAEAITVSILSVSNTSTDATVDKGTGTVSIAASDQSTTVAVGNTIFELDFETPGEAIAAGGFDGTLGDENETLNEATSEVTGGKLVVQTTEGDINDGTNNGSDNDFTKTVDLSDPALTEIFLTTRFDNPFNQQFFTDQDLTGESVPNFVQQGIVLGTGTQLAGEMVKLVWGGVAGNANGGVTGVQMWSKGNAGNGTGLSQTANLGQMIPGDEGLFDVASIEMSLAVNKTDGTLAQYVTLFDDQGTVIGGTRPEPTPGFHTTPPVTPGANNDVLANVTSDTELTHVGVHSSDNSSPVGNVGSFEATWDFLRLSSPQFVETADTDGPTAQIQPILPTTPTGDFVVTVTYTDASDVDPASIDVNDVVVAPLVGGSGPGTATSADFDDATNVATYTFTAPQGGWENGEYSIGLADGEVADLASPANTNTSSSAIIADLQILFDDPTDTTPPQVTIELVTPTTPQGTLVVTLTATDETALDPTSVSADDILVNFPPDSVLPPPPAVAVTANQDNTSIEVQLTYTAPAGGWSNGDYSAEVAASAVSDTGGNSNVAGASIGDLVAFTDTLVSIAGPGDVVENSDGTAQGDAQTLVFTLSTDDAAFSGTLDLTLNVGGNPVNLSDLQFTNGEATYSVSLPTDTRWNDSESVTVTLSSVEDAGFAVDTNAATATATLTEDDPADSHDKDGADGADPVVVGDFSDDKSAPTDIGDLPQGETILVATQQGDSAPGDRDRDFITFTIPEGSVMTGLFLDGYVSDEDTAQAFMAIQEGTAITVDLTTGMPDDPQNPQGPFAGIVYGEGFINGDLLPLLADGNPDDAQGADFPGFTLPLEAGTYTLWMNQGGPQTQVTLRAVIEAAATVATLSVADAVSVNEADGSPLSFELTLDEPLNTTLDITYDTGDATGLTQQVTFLNGVGALTIPVVNDDVDTGDTTVTVTITAASDTAQTNAATIELAQDVEASGTIVEDDTVDPLDVDGDGILNPDDPAALDADNGMSTVLQKGGTIALEFDTPTSNVLDGSTGFTGVMISPVLKEDGTEADPYGNLTNEATTEVTAEGFLSLDTSASDTFGTQTGNGIAPQVQNRGQDLYQTLIDVSGNDQVRFETSFKNPFDVEPEGFVSAGIQIGAGDQDSFIKFVLGGNANDSDGNVNNDTGSGVIRLQVGQNDSIEGKGANGGDTDLSLASAIPDLAAVGVTDLNNDQTVDYNDLLLFVETVQLAITVDRTTSPMNLTFEWTFLDAQGAEVASGTVGSGIQVKAGSDLEASLNGQNPNTGNVGGVAFGVIHTDFNRGGNNNQSDADSVTVEYDYLRAVSLDDNPAPTVDQGIADQSTDEDAAFSFVIPTDAFADDGGVENLTLAAQVKVGDTLVDLPSWLQFDAATGTFSGTPVQDDVGTLEIEVSANDGTNDPVSTTFVLTIADVNDAPTAVLLTPTSNAVAEGTDTTGGLVMAVITVTDDTVGTNNLTLTGTDADKFEIVESEGVFELVLKEGTALDFETLAQFDVTVEVDDPAVGSTPDASESFTVTVTDVNEAPSIALNQVLTEIAEAADVSAAIKVADIVITDDALGTNTLGLDGNDAALFEIIGTELFLKANVALDFSANPVLDVAVTVDDATIGVTFEDSGQLQVNVVDTPNVPPTATPIDAGAVAETALPQTFDLVQTANDTDGGTLGVANVTAVDGAQNAVVFELNDTDITIDPLQFADQIASGESVTVTVTYDVTDGQGGSVSNTATLVVDGVDGPFTWYIDNDEDGFGTDATAAVSYDQPDGFVAADDANLDNDDNDDTVYPGAPEIPDDGKDNDQDGEIDEVDGVTQILFIDNEMTPYGVAAGELQDGSAGSPTGATSSANNTAVTLTGNAWKYVSIPGVETYELTEDSVLRFTVSSAGASEIIAIGLETNQDWSDGSGPLFQIGGTQTPDAFIQTYNTLEDGGQATYEIPLAAFAGLSIDRIALVNDNDADNGRPAVTFSNVQLVTPPEENVAPTAVDDSVSTGFGEVLTIDPATLLANDTDPNTNDTKTLVSVQTTNPAEGTVALVNGEVVFTPANGFEGTTSFTYLMEDAGGLTSSATVTVQVTPEGGDGVNLAFDADALSAYDPGQDSTGLTGAQISTDQGVQTLTLTGNAWKKLALNTPLLIEENFVISFTFSSTEVSEIMGIGLDNNNSFSDQGQPLFQVGGSQPLGAFFQQLDTYETADGEVRYTASLSDWVGQTFSHVVFINDADAPALSTSNSSFSNVFIGPRPNQDPTAVAGEFSVGGDTPLALPVSALVALGSDGDGDPLSVAGVSNAVNGTVGLDDGTVTFTPANGFVGTASFDFTLEDGFGGSVTETVTVEVNSVPVAVDDTGFELERDTPLFLTPGELLGNDLDGDGHNLSLVSVGNAVNGTVNFEDGQITFTPNANFIGVARFEYTISDGFGGTDTGEVVIDVKTSVGQGAGETEIEFVENQISSFASQDVTPDGITVSSDGSSINLVGNTWKKMLLPDEGYTITENTVLSVTVNASVIGEIIGIGLETNNELDDTDLPLFQLGGTQPLPLYFNQEFSDYDTPGQTKTYTISLSDWAGEDFTYLLLTNDQDVENPDANVTFSNVSLIEQQAQNLAPNPQPDQIDGVVNQVRVINPFTELLNNDTDPNGDTLSIAAVSSPVNGSVEIEDGVINFTPDQDFAGVASFDYTVTDGAGGEATTTVTISFNRDPVPVTDTFSILTDEPLFLAPATLLANDSDPDGNDLTLTAVGGAVNGAVVLDNEGQISFTPTTGFSGTASFTYTVVDSLGGSATGTVTIEVDDGSTDDGPLAIDFATQEVSRYSTQNFNGDATPSQDGTALTLSGNTWHKVELPKTVVIEDDTVLRFTLEVPVEGEIIAIGLDNDDNFTNGQPTFQIAGVQDWPIADDTYRTYTGPGPETFEIALGAFAGESYDFLFISNDADNISGTSSIFSNVEIFTPPDDLPPVFDSATNALVAENQTSVLTVSATDPDVDVNPATLTYGLAQTGADTSLFTIDATTGALSFLAAPDFETPGDANLDNIYEVTVTVADATTTVEQTITVEVGNVLEPGDPIEKTVLKRINAFGPEVASIDDGPVWEGDGIGAANSPYLVTTQDRGDTFGGYTGDVSLIPDGTPEAVLDSARSSNFPFSYVIPLEDLGNTQDLTIRIYLAEVFTGNQDAGDRVFDILVEGVTEGVLDNVDPSLPTDGGDLTVIEYDVTVTDGFLDIGFAQDPVDGSDNPIVSAIEVLSNPVAVIDFDAPTVQMTLTNPATATDPILIELTLADDSGIDPATLGNDDIALTIGGFPSAAVATFTGFTAGVASYEVAAPQDGWNDGIVVGVTLQQGAIADLSPAVNTTAEVSSQLTVDVGGGSTGGEQPDVIVYRINAFGPEVAANDGGPVWAGDGLGAANNPYLVTTDDRGDIFGYSGSAAAIPATVPEAVLDTTRSSDAPFSYAIPTSVLGGGEDFEVRLYIAELFTGGTPPAQSGGFRIYDATLEGITPLEFNNIDPGTDFGADVGVLSAQVKVTDGVLDIGFLQDAVQNPIVNAIEVVALGTEVDDPIDPPADPTDALAVLQNATGIDQGGATGGTGSVELRIMEGANNVQSSNFGSNSFILENTGGKDVAAVFIDFRNALYSDSVVDFDGSAGDLTFKEFSVNSGAGDTGAYFDNNPAETYFFQTEDPDPEIVNGNVTSAGGWQGLLVKFDGSDGGFQNGESIGFSGDMDPNSVAATTKSALDSGAVNGWDVGGVSGAELIGSSFTALFVDGSTATGYLGGNGNQAASIGAAVENQAEKTATVTVNGFSSSQQGAYGVTIPEIIVSGEADDVVRVTLSRGLNPVTGPTYADDVAARLQNSHPEFQANNAADFQFFDITIGANGTATLPENAFDWTAPDGGQSFNGTAFTNGFTTAPAVVGASVIDQGSEMPLGSTDRVYLVNQGGPVVQEGAGGGSPGVEGYFEMIGSGNSARFKIQIEDANAVNAGEDPGGDWTFLDAPDGEGRQSGFQGSGYYLFGSNTSNAITGNQAANALTYTILIPDDEVGLFNFRGRFSRDGLSESDQQNDLWLNFRKKGSNEDILDYLVEGTNEPDPTSGGAIKVFGGPNNGNWGNAQNWDGLPGNPPTQLNVTEGGLYEVEIIGRSDGLHVDFFEFFRPGNAPGTGASSSDFIATGPTAPTVADPIDDLTLEEGNGTTIAAASAFTDLDGDDLDFELDASSNAGQFSINEETGLITIGDGLPQGDYTLTVTATDDDQNSVSDVFEVTVVEDLPTQTDTYTIAASAGDWEQFGGGGSNDLEFGLNGSQLQYVGIRFGGITLPEGATITNAVINLTAQESNSGAAEFTIAMEDTPTAVFFSGGNQPGDQDREFTDEFVWTPEAWTAGQEYQTPDLSGLINQVVDGEGLNGNGGFVFLIDGVAGSRVADSFDAAGDNGPELVLTYEL